LQGVIERLGPFGGDNRAGIERTLHRISAVRNRSGCVIGLTCRVGRAVFGTVAMVRDLLDTGESLLLLGRPGVGKTTALREIARVLADDLGRRVMVIDTSNEIAGDGDIPHPAIGRARRLQVARPQLQHRVMIEAVENHMPEVIVIDEIGTEQEAQAARTIAERGVQLVATAHGNALANLVRNPTLSDLVGGVQAVTLGDDEARRRGSQKAVLERAAEPTFPLAVEMHSRSRWMVHGDVAATVDQLLRGQSSAPEVRSVGRDGVLVVERPILQGPRRGAPKRPPLPAPVVPLPALATALERPLRVFCCGIAPRLVLQAARTRRWPVQLTDELLRADAVLAGRHQLGRHPELRKRARDGAVPIHVIKADSLPQVQRALERLLRRHGEAEIAQGV
jgi:stage III sporulation protein SpoIIIAA